MALWPAKKEQDADAAAETADELGQLTEQLGQLGQQLDRANEQVAAYLLRRESTAGSSAPSGTPDALAEKLDALGERLDQLGSAAGDAPAAKPAEAGVDEEALKSAVLPLQKKLDSVEEAVKALVEKAVAAPVQDAIGPAVGQLNDGINAHHQAIAASIAQLQQHLDGGMQHLAQLLRPPEPEAVDESPASSAEWQSAVFGRALGGMPELAAKRQQLLDGVLAGEKAACSLAGQLLAFRSAPTEKMPPLLKEIGEAYYRWQPKAEPGSHPMEEALAAWLKRRCDEAGIGNTIELVHPGERFDNTRHTAAQRGVEITQVLGWIVLRDNGRVYTKAAVAVR